MDDLVAELTLKLRNEMNAGLDEVRGEFFALDGTLQQLRDVLGELTGELAAMRGPEQLVADFEAVTGEVDTVIEKVGGIGGAIDADIAKVKEFEGAWAAAAKFEYTFAPPPNLAPDNGAPAFIPPGTELPPEPGDDEPDEPAPNERRFKRGKGSDGPGMGLSDMILDFFAIASGWEGEKSYAEFQSTALQAAIIEGYSGKSAMDEANKIMHESYNQAYLSRGNVDDIEEAYFNLLRQKLPKDLVNSIMGPLTEAATTYDTPVPELTGPVFNLARQFGIPGDQMSQALGILGAASHLGHYYFADFGQGLPQVGVQFAKLGDTGLSGEETAASALEVVRGSTADSATASTDLSYLMTYLTSDIAARFFDRTKRSQDLLGAPVLDLFEKYHIDPLNLPAYLDSERDKGVDPLNAMVDYMHTIGADKMSPTDMGFVFNSLFHSVEASTAMQALVQNYDLFHQDQQKLQSIGPGFLDENFRTAIQGDAGGVSQYDLLGTYLDRLYGQNTFGWFMGPNGSPSQADANAAFPGSSAFNIPITLNVTVDKSGNVTANAQPGAGPRAPAAGASVRVNQGQMLGVP